MATVSVEVVDIDGLAVTYNAASGGGDKFEPGDRTFVIAKNTNGATRTATFTTPGTVGGNAIADLVVTLPATTGEVLIGPFTRDIYAGSDGLVAVAWSATTGVTFGVVRI
jgi:hypothetical protein